MAFDTKLNLSCTKFEQLTGDTLLLSGNTYFQSGSSVSFVSNAATNRILISDSGGTVTLQDPPFVYTTLFNTYTGDTQAIYDDTANPTGFINVENIDIYYDYTGRTVTLSATTGEIEYYWRGVKYSLGTTWTSPTSHPTGSSGYFLYSNDGVNFTWTTSVWGFGSIMVAYKLAGEPVVVREVHGTMPVTVHRELHETVGTYRRSGFGHTPGTYTLSPTSPTNADVTPGFEAGVIADEDNQTTLPAWSPSGYTLLYFTGTSTPVFITGNSFMYNVGTNYPYYYPYNSGYTETEISALQYWNVYTVRIPVSSDVTSQRYRAVQMQPQYTYSTLDAAEAENPQSLEFGGLSSLSPEFVLIERTTFRSSGAYVNVSGKSRIESVAIITGTRFSQSTTSTGAATTAGNVSVTPVSPFTSTNLQGLSDEYANCFICNDGRLNYLENLTGITSVSLTGATNIGGGSGVYSTTTDRELQLRSFVGSGGTIVSTVGNEIIICSTDPTGTTVSWGNVTGDIENQTDLQNCFDTFITGATNGLSISGKDVILGGVLTGNTLINLSGNTLAFTGSSGSVCLANSLMCDGKINIGECGSNCFDHVVNVEAGHINYNTLSVPNQMTVALAATGAGNLSNGTYYYGVEYLTPYGGTGDMTYSGAGFETVTVTDNSTDGQVCITNIPIGEPHQRVCARRLWRTCVNPAGGYQARCLTTINDNTTTTYLDNTADTSLGVNTVYRLPNSTAGYMYVATCPVFRAPNIFLTTVGYGAGENIQTTHSTTLVGGWAGRNMTGGSSNTLMGYSAGIAITDGATNVGIGYASTYYITTQSDNIGIGGNYAMRACGNCNIGIGSSTLNPWSSNQVHNVAVGRYGMRYFCGNYNTAIGNDTFQGLCSTGLTCGNYNTLMGFRAGYYAGNTTDKSWNIFLGACAGYLVDSGFNVGVGAQSLINLTTGGCNIGIGFCSAYNLTTGTNNLIIGTCVGTSTVGINCEFRLGHRTTYLLEGSYCAGSEILCSPYDFCAGTCITSPLISGTTFATSSTALVSNFNADLLDGLHASELTGCTSISYGIQYQIPYINAAGDDFEYGNVCTDGTDLLIRNAGGLDQYGQKLLIGADHPTYTARTDATLKVGIIAIPHYNTAQEDVLAFYGVAGNGVNQIYFGGGSTAYNSATSISFRTALNSTSTASTERMVVGGTGVTINGTLAVTGVTTGTCNDSVVVWNSGNCKFYSVPYISGDTANISVANGLTNDGQNIVLGGELTGDTYLTGGYSLITSGGTKLNTQCGLQISGVTIVDSTRNSITNIGVGQNTLINNTTGISNLALGTAALEDNTTGIYNVGVGTCTLNVNTCGSYNTAIGFQALRYNISGGSNVAIGPNAMLCACGDYNIGIGSNTLRSNTTGVCNIAIGTDALYDNTTGIRNISFGLCSQNDNTSGNDNIAIGFQALRYNTGGTANIGIGTNALLNACGNCNIGIGVSTLRSNTTGNNNFAVGTDALYDNTTGCYNVAMGKGALCSNTSGNNNFAVGVCALGKNESGGSNVAIGNLAMFCNISTTSSIAIGTQALYLNTGGTYNIAMGYLALRNNTDGDNNIAMGFRALEANTIGSNNIAFGCYSLFDNTTGVGNFALGIATLSNNTTGNYNIGIGYCTLVTNVCGWNNTAISVNSLFSNTCGYDNIGIGRASLYNNTIGCSNIAFGCLAMCSNTTGCKNVAFGCSALRGNVSGCYNIAIGDCAGFAETGSSKLYIDGTGTGTQYPLIYGDFAQECIIIHGALKVTGLTSGTCDDQNVVWNSTDCQFYVVPYLSGDTDATWGNITGTLSDQTDLQACFDATITGATNGLTKVGRDVILGGTLTGDTTINIPTGNCLTIGGELAVTGYTRTDFLDEYTTGCGIRIPADTKVTIGQTGAPNAPLDVRGGSSTAIYGSTNSSAYGLDFYNASSTGSAALLRQNSTTGAHDINVLQLQVSTTSTATTGMSAGILYRLEDAGGTTRDAGKIRVGITDPSAGVMDTNMYFCVLNNGTLTEVARLTTTGISGTTISGDGANVTNVDAVTLEGYTAAQLTGCTTYTFTNGLTELNNTVCLGGALTTNTDLTGNYTLCVGGGAKLNTQCGLQISGVTIYDVTRGDTASLRIGENTLSAYNGTTGCHIAIGNGALNKLTGGTYNVAIGRFSQCSNLNGSYNTSLGSSALQSLTTGDDNFGMGYQALYYTTTGCRNVVIGRSAMFFNCTGTGNIAMGYQSLYCNVGGQYNIGLGGFTLANVTGGSYNNAQGYLAMQRHCGSYNFAVGYFAAYCGDGSFNVAIGSQAMRNGTLRNNNVAIGQNSMYDNFCGCGNVAIGTSTVRSLNTGCYNIGVGNNAMYYQKDGCCNIALGANSMYCSTGSTGNVAIGNCTSYCDKTGACNIAIGDCALYQNVTGTGNVAIGTRAGYFETGSSRLYIDNTNTTTPLIYGEFDNNLLAIHGCLRVQNITTGTCDDSIVVWNSTDCQLYSVPYSSGGTIGAITGATNIGGGSGIYSSTVGQNLELRTLVGDGGTTVTIVGDCIRICSTDPTGTTVSWGNITGSVADQTDLESCLNTIESDISTLEGNRVCCGDFNTYTGDTQTCFTTKVDCTDFNTYTGDTSTRINTIETNYITGATNIGGGDGTIYTSVSGNELQLKTISGGTNVTITNGANYIGISAPDTSGIEWSGTQTNGIGTYVDADTICSQDNLTFNGSLLAVTGSMCATVSITNVPYIQGTCICGSSCILSPLYISTGQYCSSVITGTAPLKVDSTTLNTNLNADLLDGYHASQLIASGSSGATWGGITGTLSDQTDLYNNLSTLSGYTDNLTNNYVPYWTDASGLTDSNIFITGTTGGTRIGINRTDPEYDVDICGTLRVTGCAVQGQSLINNGLIVNNAGTGLAIDDFQVNTANYCSIYSCATGDSLTLMSNILGCIGFFGVTPTAQSTGWSATGGTSCKAYTASATTLNELSNVVSTLINELINKGLIGS